MKQKKGMKQKKWISGVWELSGLGRIADGGL